MTGGWEVKMLGVGWKSWVGFVSGEKNGEEEKLRIVNKIYRMVEYCKKSKGEQEMMKRTMQYGFVKWLHNTHSNANAGGNGNGNGNRDGVGSDTMRKGLSLDTVERMNNLMVMFSHAFGNVENLSGLFAVTSVSVSHMIRNAKGCLFLLDTKQRELFTVKGGAVIRSGLRGVVGHTARTGESVLCGR